MLLGRAVRVRKAAAAGEHGSVPARLGRGRRRARRVIDGRSPPPGPRATPTSVLERGRRSRSSSLTGVSSARVTSSTWQRAGSAEQWRARRAPGSGSAAALTESSSPRAAWRNVMAWPGGGAVDEDQVVAVVAPLELPSPCRAPGCRRCRAPPSPPRRRRRCGPAASSTRLIPWCRGTRAGPDRREAPNVDPAAARRPRARPGEQSGAS